MSMNKSFLIELPLTVAYKTKRSQRQEWVLNLNSYRNEHHSLLAKYKKLYHKSIIVSLQRLKMVMAQSGLDQLPAGKVEIIYHFWAADRRKIDLRNFTTVVDKFFCDSLTKSNIIADDNIEYLQAFSDRFHCISDDKKRHCIAQIKVNEFQFVPELYNNFTEYLV